MNFIAQLARQCWFVWQRIGINQRITIILMLLAIFGSLVAVGFWARRPEYVLLYSRLEGSDAAEIMAKLKEQDISCKFSGTQSAVLVASKDLDRARLNLASEGLPRSDSVGFEIFDENSFGMTSFTQKINHTRAVQGQLARNIASLDEIERARVMIAVPEEELFAAKQKEVKASITLRLRSGSSLSNSKVSAIKHLVAAAVPGLEARNITIIDTAGNLLSRSTGSDTVAGLTDEQLALQAAKEKHLTTKVQSMLETVLGPGKAIVRVSADLNFERVERSEEKIDPDSAVVVDESSETEESTGPLAQTASGAPGTAANVSVSQTAPNVPAVAASKKSREKINNTYDFDRTTSRTVSEVGNIKRLSVAVFIAQRHEGKGDQKKYVARPTEELKVIEGIVKSAVGFTETPARQDQVTVAEIPFDTSVSEKSVADMESAEHREMVVSLVKLGSTCGIILIVLLFFRSFLKKSPAEYFSVPLPPVDRMALPPGGQGALASGEARPVNYPGGNEGAQDDVGRMAVEQPEQVAQIVKDWMSQ